MTESKPKEGYKNYKVTEAELIMLQALPYDIKLAKSDLRIEEWYRYFGGNVAVSFSGGLDSSALLHKVRELYPNVPAVSIRAIECPENQAIIDKTDNVIILKPIKSMIQVHKEYGIPFISKVAAKSIERLQNPTEKNAASRNLALTGYSREGNYCPRYKLAKKYHKLIDSKFRISSKCCYYMKEKPQFDYVKETDVRFFIGTKAADSRERRKSYLQTSCNSFSNKGTSTPLGFWTDQDILRYTVENNIPVSEAYGEVYKDEEGIYHTTKASKTGCFTCLFGINLEKEPNRLQRMEVERPQMYKFCIETLEYGELLDFMDIHYRIDQMPEEKQKDLYKLYNIGN
jgi:3'-phosphoadenosine 5'-phosphosulfate sulfotransferase (PAPS reductase)/FAD synthetase